MIHVKQRHGSKSCKGYDAGVSRETGMGLATIASPGIRQAVK